MVRVRVSVVCHTIYVVSEKCVYINVAAPENYIFLFISTGGMGRLRWGGDGAQFAVSKHHDFLLLFYKMYYANISS